MRCPDVWIFNTKDIINQFSEGRDVVYTALKELEIHGYLTRTQIREKGKFTTCHMLFHEKPKKIT